MKKAATFIAVILAHLVPLAFATMAEGKTKRFYRDDLQLLSDTSFVLQPYGQPAASTVEICFSFPGKNEGFFSKSRQLTLFWNETADGDYHSVSFSPGSTNMDDMVDTRFIAVTVERCLGGKKERLAEIKANEGVGLGNQENVASLALNPQSVEIGLGHREPSTIWEENIVSNLNQPITVRVVGDVYISEVVSEYEADVASELATPLHREDFLNQPEESKTGMWTYLDRKTDSDFAKIGGRYSLGIINDRENPGSLLIVYLDGAEVNSSRWKEGMIKGRLKATPFENHFDLEWYDSKMDIIDRDSYADFDDQNILTLSFPLMNSSVRFYKGRP